MKLSHILNKQKFVLPKGLSGEIYVIKYNKSLYTVKKFKNHIPDYHIINEYKTLQRLSQYYDSNFPKPYKLILHTSHNKLTQFNHKFIDKTGKYILYQYINGTDSRNFINYLKNLKYDIDYYNYCKKNNTFTLHDTHNFNKITNEQFITNIINTIKTYLVNIAKLIYKVQKIGIAHLDIKPENIILENMTKDMWLNYKNFDVNDLLNMSQNMYLIDFGFNKPVNLYNKKLINTNRCGTIKYISPEMLNKQYNCTSDVYSFGIILQEILDNTKFYFEYCEQLNDSRLLLKNMLKPKTTDRYDIIDVLNDDWLNSGV